LEAKKKEEFLVAKKNDMLQARKIIEQYVWTYNNLSTHRSLNYKAPHSYTMKKPLTFHRLGS
jgi:transposase InsO family protein